MRNKFITGLGISLGLALMSGGDASATAIMKFSLGDTGPDLIYTAGVFSTVDDGDALTFGDQDTSVRFVGPLAFMPDILVGASFSLAGVTASGFASITSGVVAQSTVGGTFNLYDEGNVLLLSGVLDQGVISGGMSSSTGSFFNSTAAIFTGGTLLAYIAPSPAGLSVALSDILNDSGSIGMAFIDDCTEGCQLRDFYAAGDQLVDGNPIPEPASALLLTSGLAGAFLKRRKALRSAVS